MVTLAGIFPPMQPPEQIRPVAAAAESAGLAQLWVWEDCFKESGIATATAMLATTSRVTVAIGLLPVPLRNVALTAMELATLSRLLWLPLRQRVVLEACSSELRVRLRLIGKERKWTRGQVERRHAQARATTRNYLRSVLRVSQFSAYERVFALWHVLHVPFVYLLLVTAIFHVIAVHAY